MVREILLAVLTAISAAAVTIGVHAIYPPAAWIIGGVLLSGWSWLVLAGSTR